jgi:peptidoglycan/LPS O-acetylase OafA/YrhL
LENLSTRFRWRLTVETDPIWRMQNTGTTPSANSKAWRAFKVVLWVVALLVLVQDFTGALAGRRILLRAGQVSSKNAEILQLRTSAAIPSGGRAERQIQVWQDGRRLRGPYFSIQALSDTGEGTFTAGKNLWARIYKNEGSDPAKTRFVARVPAIIPPWLSWPLYLGVLGISFVPWTRRYYRNHPPSPGKIKYLESVRGLACLLVLSTHFYSIFLSPDNPAPVPSSSDVGFAWWHREVPLVRLFTGGAYAVQVFFVLSGFVLCLPFLSRKTDLSKRLCEAALRRPIRLYGLVMAVMLMSHLVVGSYLPYDGYFMPARLWPDFLLDLAHPFSTATEYAGAFWTISYELLGALGVYLFLLLLGGKRLRWIAYPVVFLLLKGQLYQGFLFGMVLADLWHARQSLPPSAWMKWSGPVLMILGLLLGSFAEIPGDRGVYDAWLAAWLPSPYQWIGGGFTMIGAVLTVAAVLISPTMQRWLSHSWLVALGRISFSVYAIHSLVLITVPCWLFDLIHPGATSGRFRFQPDGGAYMFHVVVALFAFVGVTIVIAAWLTAAVDEPCVRLSHKFGRWVMRRSPAPSAPEQKASAVPVS